MKKKKFILILIILIFVNFVTTFVIKNENWSLFSFETIFSVSSLLLGLAVVFGKYPKEKNERKIIFSIVFSILISAFILSLKTVSVLRAAKSLHQDPQKYLEIYPLNLPFSVLSFFILYYLGFLLADLMKKKIKKGLVLKDFFKPSTRKLGTFIPLALLFPVSLLVMKNDWNIFSIIAGSYVYIFSMQ